MIRNKKIQTVIATKLLSSPLGKQYEIKIETLLSVLIRQCCLFQRYKHSLTQLSCPILEAHRKYLTQRSVFLHQMQFKFSISVIYLKQVCLESYRTFIFKQRRHISGYSSRQNFETDSYEWNVISFESALQIDHYLKDLEFEFGGIFQLPICTNIWKYFGKAIRRKSQYHGANVETRFIYIHVYIYL